MSFWHRRLAPQAREMWRIFRTVVDKPIARCDRDDRREVVKHLEKDKAPKSTTLKRYMVPLIAIVNLAIDEGKHTGINPFANCVPIARTQTNATHSATMT